MKILHTKTLKDGRRHVLVELSKDEPNPSPSLDPKGFYKLNYPLEDEVIAGHLLTDLTPVHWCSATQKWV